MKLFVKLAIAFFLAAQAVCVPANEGTQNEVNVDMDSLSQVFVELYPILYNDELFFDPANTKSIEEMLQQMSLRFSSASQHFSYPSLTQSIGLKVFTHQLTHALEDFKHGNLGLAQVQLQQITGNCSACHIQDNRPRTLTHEKLKLPAFESKLALAEFQFMTRDYESALATIEEMVMSGVLNPAQQVKWLLRALIINIDILNEPEAIRNTLLQYETSEVVSTLAKQHIHDWIKGIDDYLTHLNDTQLDSASRFNAYMSSHYNRLKSLDSPIQVDESEKVFLLLLQDAIHQYLMHHPGETEAPMLLYWLAVCDHALQESVDYSLASAYLRECVYEHTDHPYARECFTLFNDSVTLLYSGSSGTHVPPGLAAELKTMASLTRHHAEH